MTVSECIEKHRHNSKVKRIWICPNIVRNPKVGKNYTCTISIESKPKAAVLNCKVTKHWIEDGAICIIYLTEGEPIIFT